MLDAGFSALWFQGWSQNITVTGNWIERPGFCGAYLQGIYPGDTTANQAGAIAGGPIDTVEKSNINFGHTISNNAIIDYGKRVGHGSGLWFFQAGNTTVAHNQIVEGPRDAFGVYGVRFGCFSRYGISRRCASNPSDPDVNMLYGKPCDWWCGLRALHTRHIEIMYNKVANVVRDTSDAGALEYWGVGAFNTAHHNCFSDMYVKRDSGCFVLTLERGMVHPISVCVFVRTRALSLCDSIHADVRPSDGCIASKGSWCVRGGLAQLFVSRRCCTLLELQLKHLDGSQECRGSRDRNDEVCWLRL